MAPHACSGFNSSATMKHLLCSRSLSFAWRAVGKAAASADMAETSHKLCTISYVASRARGPVSDGHILCCLKSKRANIMDMISRPDLPCSDGHAKQAKLALFQAMQVTRVDRVSEGGRGHCHSHSRVRRGSLPVMPACSPMSLLLYSSCWPGPTPSSPSASGAGLASSVPSTFAAAGSAVTACI